MNLCEKCAVSENESLFAIVSSDKLLVFNKFVAYSILAMDIYSFGDNPKKCLNCLVRYDLFRLTYSLSSSTVSFVVIRRSIKILARVILLLSISGSFAR